MKPSQRSTVRVSVRVSARDRAELVWRARSSGLSMSAYLLTMALQTRPLSDPRRPPSSVGCGFPIESAAASASKNRDAFLQIRVTPADRDRLRQVARAARCPLSTYLLLCGCRRPVSTPLNLDLIEARRQLARIANNVSQLHRLFRDAPEQPRYIGLLRQAVLLFQCRLQSPASHLDLVSLAPSLQRFGQALNTSVVEIHLGRRHHLPDQVLIGLMALRRAYLIEEEGAAS